MAKDVQLDGKVKNVSSIRWPGKDGGTPIIVTTVVIESVSVDEHQASDLVGLQHEEVDIRAKFVPLQKELPLSDRAKD